MLHTGHQDVVRGDYQAVELDVYLATLDDPDAVVPEMHIWVESQLPWFKLADNLPRHSKGSWT